MSLVSEPAQLAPVSHQLHELARRLHSYVQRLYPDGATASAALQLPGPGPSFGVRILASRARPVDADLSVYFASQTLPRAAVTVSTAGLLEHFFLEGTPEWDQAAQEPELAPDLEQLLLKLCACLELQSLEKKIAGLARAPLLGT